MKIVTCLRTIVKNKIYSINKKPTQLMIYIKIVFINFIHIIRFKSFVVIELSLTGVSGSVGDAPVFHLANHPIW